MHQFPIWLGTWLGAPFLARCAFLQCSRCFLPRLSPCRCPRRGLCFRRWAAEEPRLASSLEDTLQVRGPSLPLHAAPLRLNSLCRRWLIDTTVTQTRPLCYCSLRGAPPPCCRRAGGRAAGRPLPAQARRRRGGAQDAALLGRVALCGWAQLGAGAAGTKGAERRDLPHALARGQVHLHSHKHAASWCSECSRRRGWGAPRARG